MKMLLTLLLLFQGIFNLDKACANPFEYSVLGVIASTKDKGGVALLKKKASGQVAAFKSGYEVAPQFRIEKIEQKTVTFSYEGKKFNLTVGDENPTEVKSSDSNSSSLTNNLQNADGIEKTGDTLKVSRALKESLSGENLNKVLMQAAAVPHVQNGRLIGFQLFEIDPGSIFDVAGFRNGDIITEINEKPINDAALAIKALNALKAANSANFGYIRGETPMQLVVKIN